MLVNIFQANTILSIAGNLVLYTIKDLSNSIQLSYVSRHRWAVPSWCG